METRTVWTVKDKVFSTKIDAIRYANELDITINRPNMFNPEKRVDTTIRQTTAQIVYGNINCPQA
jgi:hypothetical protein